MEPRVEGSPFAARVPALDGLRGIAVLGVMAAHVMAGTAVTFAQSVVMGICAFGTHGVDLFFALSGFLITGILYDTLGDRGYFRKFYMRRVLRIFPAYYLILAGFALAGVVWHLHYWQRLLSLALFLQNTYRVGPPIWFRAEQQGVPLGPWWSVAVEEQFYVVWAVVVYLLRGRRKILGAALGFSALAFGLRIWFRHRGGFFHDVYVGTPYRMDALLMGGVLAMLLRGPAAEGTLRWAKWVCGAGVIWLVVDAWVLPEGGPVRLTVGYSAMAVLCAAVLAVVLGGGWLARGLTWSPMRWVGRYSYGAYLIHMPIWFFLAVPARAWMSARGIKGSLVSVGTGVSVMVLSLLVAWGMFEGWERRFLRLKRYWAYELKT